MKLDSVYRRILLAGLVFVLILSVGTFGYWLIDDNASLIDSLYMTVLTVSTIGFHEPINLDNNTTGRLFTIGLAFSGIGILTYFLSNISALLIEGELRQNYLKRKMENKIAKLENHYIICGAGRVGYQIAHELSDTQRTFVIADLLAARVEKVAEDIDNTLHLVGDCTDDDFLEKLGVPQAKGIFVCTDEDNANLVICLSAKQMKKSIRVVSMCKDPRHIKKIRVAGADRVISPAFIGGSRMASEMFRPNLTQFMEFIREHDDKLRIEEISIPKHWQGKTIGDLQINQYEQTLIMAISEQDQWKVNPPNDYVLQAKSIIVVLTNANERKKLEAFLGDLS